MPEWCSQGGWKLPNNTDYLLQTTGGVTTPITNVWVQAVNNVSAAAFVSTAPTTSVGLFTILAMQPGVYTLNQGPTAVGPFTSTGNTNYVVGDTPGDHIATSGTAPTVGTVNAGISGTPALVGNDQCGTITFTTTGAPPGANSNLFQVTFAVAYAFTPALFVCQQQAAATADVLFVGAGVSATSFFVDAAINALAASKQYILAYLVIQPRVV